MCYYYAAIGYLCCLALLAADAHAISDADDKQRMRGGQDADIADYPYQVSMQHKGAHDCGGSIIGRRHVLTAAHCVHDGERIKLALDDVTILAGSTLSVAGKAGGRVYRVEKIAAHEGWTNGDSYINDIAVITLAEDIEFNALAQPIDLPTEELATISLGVTTGWGIEKEYATEHMIVLQKAAMEVIPHDECRRMMPGYALYPGHVCGFQRMGVGVCTGDSGGPLAIGNVLVGVTSWGMTPCGDGYPDVFANVYYYKDWILEKMQGR